MALPRLPLALVFDMDGLLCDTEVVYRDVMAEVVATMGLAFSDSLFRSMIGLPGPMGDRQVLNHYGEDFPIEAFNTAVRDRVDEVCLAGIALKPGVHEILDHLDTHSVPRAIATSSSPRAVEAHLGHSGILPRFHTVVARGDYERGKPSPDPFLVAAARLGVAPQDCLALEDSHNGVRSASAAGMMTVMVPDLLDPTEEMHRLCVRIARDLHEVRTLLVQAGMSIQ